jgi:hypothetical protein
MNWQRRFQSAFFFERSNGCAKKKAVDKVLESDLCSFTADFSTAW